MTEQSYEELLGELKRSKKTVADYRSNYPSAHPDADETARQFENTIILLNKAIVSGGHTKRYLTEVWGYSENEFESAFEAFSNDTYFIEMGYGADIYFPELNARSNRGWSNEGFDPAEYSNTNAPAVLRNSEANLIHQWEVNAE